MWWKILLIILFLIFLFFWQSIHIIIRYDKELTLIAGLGPIRLNVLKLLDSMKKKPKKKKEKKPKEEKEEQPEVEKSNVFKDVLELRGVDGAVDLLSQFATLLSKFSGGLARHFVIRKLFVRYSVTAKDSARVGEKFGKINAAIFTSIGVIASASQLKHHDVVITPDFLGKKDSQQVDIHLSYRLLSLLAVLLGALKDFLGIMKREKNINARIKARARQRALAKEKEEYLEEMKQSTNQTV